MAPYIIGIDECTSNAACNKHILINLQFENENKREWELTINQPITHFYFPLIYVEIQSSNVFCEEKIFF